MQHLGKTKGSLEYEAIVAYLNGELDLQAALDIFCRPVETVCSNSEAAEAIEESLRRAWQAVVAIDSSLEHSSGDRQELVDFVLAVSNRSLSKNDGEDRVIQNAKIWEDLPFFGMEMREAWNLAATSNSSIEQQKMWTNLNAWTATLVATTQANGCSSPDFSLYGIWTIRAALEEDDPSNPALEAAAIWLTYAPTCILQLCREGKTFDGKLARAGTLFRDQEWRGFNEARWAAWKARLKDIRREASRTDVMQILEGAIHAMAAGEQGH